MPDERGKKIEGLYQAALLLPPEIRANFLEQLRAGDPDLCAEVEARLKAAGKETSLQHGSPFPFKPPGIGSDLAADKSAMNDQPGAGADAPTGPGKSEGDPTPTAGPREGSAGAVIGSYQLLQPIGQGGMGEVWLAEQQPLVRRRVATKLIRAGMDTREVVARFEAERQALALMDHPAIAKVFEAGTTPQGRPYFVMEYVVGMPITDYCDQHRLNTLERLELFIHVCEGVQHAHQKAIIHRDLKPTNILISEVDGKPTPKIIDFGVAKAIGQRLTTQSMLTSIGSIVGTPAYMSPEQTDVVGEDIDTRARRLLAGRRALRTAGGGAAARFQKPAL
jgi:tRNA A-37 threonylcarbamoyl transferase component Bud32